MRPPFSLFPSFLFLFLLAIHVSTAKNLIHDTCKSIAQNDPNINYNFCTTSLQAAPASQCAGLRGLGMISIRLIRYNVTDTRCKIKHLLQIKKLDPFVRACLDDCYELYDDAIPSIKQAMKHYNSKLFVDANMAIGSVLDAASTCEDGFKDKKGVVSPLTKRNNDTFQLSALALSAMQIIQTSLH
ncbi:unnamed protein product [Ilex paraguariensis]|uniref:Pectinesterase inhibitor domain-containing protein n=1 Tax=Ilex paraguariensis TaxID=185542 RepID=A0ABC8S4B3_9AQUA